MKKDRISIFILVVLIIVLCYFIFAVPVARETHIDIPSEEIPKEENLFDSNNDLGNSVGNGNVGGFEVNSLGSLISAPSSSKLYYDQLTNTQKEIYDTLEKGCSNFESEIKVKNVSRDDLIIASYALGMEHPEFFWIKRYTYDLLNNMYVTTVYYDIPSDARISSASINSKVNSIFEEMRNQGIESDYDKLKYFYEWIINNTDYGDTSDSQEITSVFINNTSVCAGYSKAFLYLCQKANIECAYIAGTTRQNERHAWNLVKLGNNYYWVDVTWGDPVFAGDGGSRLNYNYFMVDDSELFKNHTITKGVESSSDYPIYKTFEFPSCLDDSLNYYKTNSSYFEFYNPGAISNYIRSNFRNKNYDNIEIKFKDENGYNSFLNEYLQRQNAKIYDDIKAVNPGFHGTMSVNYETVETSNYVKISVKLSR